MLIQPQFHPESVAEELLGRLVREFPLQRIVNLEWRPFRTTAGTANFTTNTIALAKTLLNDPEKLERTLKHEYAHLLAFHRHGMKSGRGHGPAWRQAMIDLGEKPEVHHKYECQRNQSRQSVTYICVKCNLEIVRRRRLPLRKKYFHTGCGGDIKLAKIQRVVSQAVE